MSDERVLVTGATGFVGKHLARRLAGRGARVRALVRDRARGRKLEEAGIDVVVGDLRDPPSLREAVRGVERVYHIAALFRTEGVPSERFREVNADGTLRLLEAAQDAGVRRFVHCSTVGVHGEIEHPPADEDAPLDPDDHYQASKLQGERYARRFFDGGGMEVAVFRPGGIYGPGDSRFLKLFRAIARRRFVMIGSGEVLYHLVYIDDLIDGILLCGSRPEAAGEVVILTGAEAVTLNELVEEIARSVGTGIPNLRLPAAPVYAAAALCEFLCRPLGVEPPLYRRRMDFFLKDRSFDIGKARRLLGYAPEVDLEEGIARTAAWYRERDLL